MAEVVKLVMPDNKVIDIADAYVRGLIPSGASNSNKLTTKQDVAEAVSTNSANFLGTYDYYPTISNTQPSSPLDIDNAYIGGRLELVVSSTPSNNDYVFVSINYSSTIDEDEFRRFKYNSETATWGYEFSIRNAAFSQAQWDAINSGINSTKVGNYDNHLADKNNPHQVTKKQVGLENVDNTADANKPVSTAQQTALDNKADSVAIAPAYSASSAYAVGTIVTYKGKRYKCNTAIGGGGEAWNAAHWTEESIETALGDKANTADLKKLLNINVPMHEGTMYGEIVLTMDNGDVYRISPGGNGQPATLTINGDAASVGGYRPLAQPQNSGSIGGYGRVLCYSVLCKSVQITSINYYQDDNNNWPYIVFNGVRQTYTAGMVFNLISDTNTLSIRNAWCLAPDTYIAIPNGYKKLCNLNNGDKVISIDENGNVCEDEVIETDAGEPPKYGDTLDIWRFSDGTEIKTIHPHEFYSADEKKFKYIADFAIGERVVLQDGSTAALKSHEQEQGKFQHMTLFTKKNNTYFANGILTGNRQSVKISKEW